jgi:hypothetical protein
LEKLGAIILQGFLGITPTLCVGESEEVEMQGHVVLQGVLPNAEEPVVGGPGLNHLVAPVKT